MGAISFFWFPHTAPMERKEKIGKYAIYMDSNPCKGRQTEGKNVEKYM